MNNAISKEDYEEPICPFCTPDKHESIPTGRVLEKLDEYLSKNNYVSAERHLKYWLEEADGINDNRGKLSVMNEFIGLYRKLERKEEALRFCEKSLELAEKIGLADTVTMGTTLVNAATAYKAFGKAEKAVPLYEKAKTLYEKNLTDTDERLGGLYNNMGLAFLELEKFKKAEELFIKALNVMAQNKGCEPESAITFCNLANLAEAELGLEDGDEKIHVYLEKAMEFLDTEGLKQDGSYAYVCEKCAPTFGYYGYFAYEKELTERSRRIYERT